MQINRRHEMVLNACENVQLWDKQLRQRFDPVYGADLQNVWSALVRSVKTGNVIGKHRLHEIKVPTLVLHGEQDFIDKQEVNYIINAIKGCRQHRFPTGGHDIHIQHHQEFNKIVDQFLRK